MNPFIGMLRTAARPGSPDASRNMRLNDGRRVVLRAARPGDEPAVQRFVRGLSVRSRRARFFSPLVELAPEQLAQLIPSSSTGGYALVAEAFDDAGACIVGLAQYVVCEPLDAEFALVVDDAWQRHGLGLEMLGLVAEHAARSGLAAIVGFVLSENWPMLTLLSRLDCEFADDTEPGVVRAVKRFDARESKRAREDAYALPAFAPDFVARHDAVRDRLDCLIS